MEHDEQSYILKNYPALITRLKVAREIVDQTAIPEMYKHEHNLATYRINELIDIIAKEFRKTRTDVLNEERETDPNFNFID